MPHKLGDYPIIPLESSTVLLPSPTEHFLDLTGQDPFARLDSAKSRSSAGPSSSFSDTNGATTTVTSPVEMEAGECLPTLSMTSNASNSTLKGTRASPWTISTSTTAVHKASSYSHLLRTTTAPVTSSHSGVSLATSPTRYTYAYQKPAFKPRPSLPSLHALAKMNIPVPNKVRKGRVGATLPAEPWDTLSPDTLSPQSSRAQSPAPGFVSRYGYGMDESGPLAPPAAASSSNSVARTSETPSTSVSPPRLRSVPSMPMMATTPISTPSLDDSTSSLSTSPESSENGFEFGIWAAYADRTEFSSKAGDSAQIEGGSQRRINEVESLTFRDFEQGVPKQRAYSSDIDVYGDYFPHENQEGAPLPAWDEKDTHATHSQFEDAPSSSSYFQRTHAYGSAQPHQSSCQLQTPHHPYENPPNTESQGPVTDIDSDVDPTRHSDDVTYGLGSDADALCRTLYVETDVEESAEGPSLPSSLSSTAADSSSFDPTPMHTAILSPLNPAFTLPSIQPLRIPSAKTRVPPALSSPTSPHRRTHHRSKGINFGRGPSSSGSRSPDLPSSPISPMDMSHGVSIDEQEEAGRSSLFSRAHSNYNEDIRGSTSDYPSPVEDISELAWDVQAHYDYHAHAPSPPPLTELPLEIAPSQAGFFSASDSLTLSTSTSLPDDHSSDPNHLSPHLAKSDGSHETGNLVLESAAHSHISSENEPICGHSTTSTSTSTTPMPLLSSRSRAHAPPPLESNSHSYSRSPEQRLGGRLRSNPSSTGFRTAPSSPPQSDDEAVESSSSSSLSEKAGSDSEEDDVPLAQQIPTALRAQRTIRRQVREEREKRRRERGAARAALDVHGYTSRAGAGTNGMSSSQEAAAAAHALSSSVATTHLSPASPPRSRSSHSHSDNTASASSVLQAGMNAVPPPMSVMTSTTNTNGNVIDPRTVAPGHATSKPIARSGTRTRTKTLPGNAKIPSQVENVSASARLHGSGQPGQGPSMSQGQYLSQSQTHHHQQQYQQQYPHQHYSQSQPQQYPHDYSQPHPQQHQFPHPVLDPSAKGRTSVDEFNRKRSLSLHRNQHLQQHQSQHGGGVQLYDVPVPSPASAPMSQSSPHASLSHAHSQSSRPHRSMTISNGHSGGANEDSSGRAGRSLGRSNTTARARSRSRAPGGGGLSPLPHGHGLHPQSPINPDLLPPPPPIPGLSASFEAASFDPRHSRVPTPASRAQEKALEKAVEKPTQYQYRIYMGDSESYNMVDVKPGTNAKDVILMMQDGGMMKGWMGSGEWMLWEVWKDFGMERPIRTFEIVSDVVGAWDSGRTVNKLIAKISPLAPALSRSALPSSAPTCSGYVDWEAKRGKWTKKFLMLKENGLYVAKREHAKEELLCSLSNFDAYIVTRAMKAPKPFSFAVKSTDDLSFFEDKSDYMHVFSCEEKTGMKWIERILVARSFVLYQEKSTLFTTSNGAAPAGLARSGTTRKRAPTISAPAAPISNGGNMTVSHTSMGGMQGTLLNMAPAAMFEPGSLLSKQRAMS